MCFTPDDGVRLHLFCEAVSWSCVSFCFHSDATLERSKISFRKIELESKLKSKLHDTRPEVIANFSVADIVRSITRLPGSGERTAKKIYSTPLRVVERVEGFPPEL